MAEYSSNNSLRIFKGKRLDSESSAYIVEKHLGVGTFGWAVKCHKTATKEKVVLKIVRRTCKVSTAAMDEEEKILKQLNAINPDKYNVVRWSGSFVYSGHLCQEFELLDINLKEFLNLRRKLPLKEIRPVIHQLATALDALKNLGIVHADLKPQNIMMVEHVTQPLKVKVIDFGSSFHVDKAKQGRIVQTRWYRSPEVLLGLPYTEAIDMWSLGCIAVELLQGSVLYPGNCEYGMIWSISQSHTEFPRHLLNAGLKTSRFFKYESDQWRAMTPVEYGVPEFSCFTHLDELKKIHQKPDDHLSAADTIAYTADVENFVELVKEMLQLDPSKRITPRQVLQHPFMTMHHMRDIADTSDFAKSCVHVMDSCLFKNNSACQDESAFTQQPPSDCATLDLPAVSASSSVSERGTGKPTNHSSTLTRNSINAKVTQKRNRSPDGVSPGRKRMKICKEGSPSQTPNTSTSVLQRPNNSALLSQKCNNSTSLLQRPNTSTSLSCVGVMDSCHFKKPILHQDKTVVIQQPPSDRQASTTHDLPAVSASSSVSQRGIPKSTQHSSSLTRNTISAKVTQKRSRSPDSVSPERKRTKICKEGSLHQAPNNSTSLFKSPNNSTLLNIDSSSETYKRKRVSYDTEEEDTHPSKDSERKRIRFDRHSTLKTVPSACTPSANDTKTCLKRTEVVPSTSSQQVIPPSLMEPKTKSFSTRKPGKTRNDVWIIGSSYIERGETEALDIFGPNLGLFDARVKWFGKEDMRWNDVLPRFYAELSAQSCPPDVLVVHAGGNDLGLLSASELSTFITRDLTRLHKEFPSMKILYSHINERQIWRHGKPLRVFKDRKIVNTRITKDAGCFGGETVEHPSLRYDNNKLYERDGVHFTTEGNDVFFTSIRRVIKNILRQPSRVNFKASSKL